MLVEDSPVAVDAHRAEYEEQPTSVAAQPPTQRIGLVSFSGDGETPDAMGSWTHLSALAEALARQGHEVTVFTRRHAGPTRDRHQAGPYEVVELAAGPPNALTETDAKAHLGEYSDRLGRCLRERTLDVVHSHTWLAGIAARQAMREEAPPLAHTFHQVHLAARDGAGRRLRPGPQAHTERLLARRAEHVIALSRTEQDMLNLAGVPRRRTSVVPAGVNTDVMHPDGPAEEPGRDFRLVLFGPPERAVPVVRALAAVPDTELLCSAALPEDTEPTSVTRLLRLARKINLGDRVHWAPRADPARRAGLLRSADLVVSFASPDHADWGHLEALACGVPVVAGSTLAAEAVIEHTCGLHLRTANVRAIAQALRELLGHDTLRQGMGYAARDRALGRYTWSRVATETTQAYHDLIAA